ncbi:type VI secretion system tube protein Hcp [Cyanobacteria bacterium FACHB-63]|nr:type VI secretion system tube protein Hcp [Cyanobacteria bacterium FACHB-63]
MGVIVHDANTDVSFEYFLKIDGIEGDSQDTTHPREIRILDWSWGESQTADSASGGAGAGKVKMQDFVFTMLMNRASPQLLLACAAGKHLRKATLTGRKVRETPQEFLKITFSDVVVTMMQTESNSTSCRDQAAKDRISLRYSVLEYEYTTQKLDGSPDSVRVGWNLKENRSV